MSKTFKDKKTDKLLLLEGINDCHVIVQICLQHQLPQLFKPYNSGGHNEALDDLELLIRSDERPEIIGIVLDTDKPEDNPSIASRLEAIKTRLHRVCNAYSIPAKMSQEGVIIPAIDGFPKIGVWLMPNNSDIGMLEDFLMALTQEKHQPSLDFAKQCVDKAQEQKLSTFRPVQYAKAIIHTYLAWHQPEPGTTLGLAIKAGNLNSNAPLAISFVTWLKELFEI